MDKQIHVGTFFLIVDMEGKSLRFLVDNFTLSKAVGQITSLSVAITDSTQVSIKESNVTRNLGSFGSMLQLLTDAVADNGKLRLCKLCEISPQGNGYTYEWWFTGRLCAIAPKIDTSTGIRVGMSCQCLGRICLLMYQPFIDFVYTPVSFASNIKLLLANNVFLPLKITTAMYSAADKMGTLTLMSNGKIGKEDTIIAMLSKAMKQMYKWLKGLSESKTVLASMPEVKLLDYILGDLCLAKIVQEKGSALAHPYVKCLLEDFLGSLQSTTLLDAIIHTLGYNDRLLTLIPADRHNLQDKMTIVPCALAKFLKGDEINPEHIISYALSANPEQRLREPDKIFVRVPWGGGWGSQTSLGISGKEVSSLLGEYAIKKDPQRLKLLYAPKWLFDIILQETYKENTTKTASKAKPLEPLTNKDAYASANKQQIQQLNVFSKAINKAADFLKRSTAYLSTKKLLDAFAKNLFFSTYRMSTYANVSLAVTDYTLSLDEKLGKSIKINIPTSAKSIVNKKYTPFYGRLLSISYSYQAAKSIESASSLNLYCVVSGLTSEASQGSTLFKLGNNILYVNKGNKNA